MRTTLAACERAGLQLSDLSKYAREYDPDEAVPFTARDEIWRAIASRAASLTFGLEIAEQIEFSLDNIFFHLLIAQRDLKGLLETVVRYQPLIWTSPFSIERHEAGATLTLLIETESLPTPSIRRDFALRSMHLGAEWALNRPVRATEVHLTGRPHAAVVDRWRSLGCAVRTGTKTNGITFPTDELDSHSARESSESVRSLLIIAAEHGMVNPAAPSLVERTSSLLHAHFLAGRPELATLETIARSLGVSERSLQRRLCEADQEFRRLLQRSRSLATRDLARQGFDRREIARRLGYRSSRYLRTEDLVVVES